MGSPTSMFKAVAVERCRDIWSGRNRERGVQTTRHIPKFALEDYRGSKDMLGI